MKNEIKKINLGCGSFKLPGYINVDNRKVVKPDILADVLDGLPFDDGELDEVSCTEFLEHFDCVEVIMVLREIHRVLKKGGLFRFGVPNGEESVLLLRDFLQESREVRDREYLMDNVYGQKLKEWEGCGDEKEINARRHRSIFSELYLKLLLESCCFKKVEFGQHMSAYATWKEKYKLIGKAICLKE